MQLSKRLWLLDTSAKPQSGDILFPFAFDEIYGRKVGQERMPPLLHIWRHHRAFVLGAGDRFLPNVARSLAWLHQLGYETGVRNSGGAAVPLDPGVVNLSLMLPNPGGSLNIREHFSVMARLVGASLRRFSVQVEAGEIGGAYCPGEFDLAIGGRKFCGIAQRRQSGSVIVQAFVNVEGSGADRGETVRQFYEIAAEGSPPDRTPAGKHPVVRPASMASLAELVGHMDVETFVRCLKEHLSGWGDWTEYREYTLLPPDEIRARMDELRMRHPMRR